MVTAIIWFTHFYRTQSALVASPKFCLIWVYLDFALTITTTILAAWASIERHILIFHKNLISTPLKRWIFHYFPLIIFTIYPFIFYIVGFFVLPCPFPFNYKAERRALEGCTGYNEKISMWDNWANNVVPVLLIIIFSISLIARVWYGKYRMGHRFQWRKYRKMFFQLLSIFTLYFVLFLPAMILYAAYALGLSYFLF
ncbi:unnamed protein product [Adineta ricciae]|uniref:G-protein coupled receptors family 1 profile domain-containing protein n=1 Tax=Adineta ricciae TaxID=249248 RepID=A0A815P5D0_ADIRI|nr:unnamed protein product [Adineta ricciae]CAF1444364.1 unnamed protein product [Adineta ricciae]